MVIEQLLFVRSDSSKLSLLAILNQQARLSKLLTDFTAHFPDHIQEFVWFEVGTCFRFISTVGKVGLWAVHLSCRCTCFFTPYCFKTYLFSFVPLYFFHII